MALSICIFLGLAAAVVTFVYICWYRHVRDNTPDKERRILYYFLISLTFVALSHVIGISVVFGVLPMLLFLLFVPKKGLLPVLGLAAFIGLLNFFAFYREIDYLQAELQKGFEQPNDEIEWQFDPNEYFKSKAIDDTIEFEIERDVRFGDFKFNIPVPKGFELHEITEEKRNGDTIFGITIKNIESLSLDITLQNIRNHHGYSYINGAKRTLNMHLNKKDILQNIENGFYEKNKRVKEKGSVFVAQNTQGSIILYYPLEMIRETPKQIDLIGFAVGGIQFQDKYLSFIATSTTYSDALNETYLLSWLDSFIKTN